MLTIALQPGSVKHNSCYLTLAELLACNVCRADDRYAITRLHTGRAFGVNGSTGQIFILWRSRCAGFVSETL